MIPMTTDLPTTNALEGLLIRGDLSALNDAQRLQYYHKVCDSLGLNPLTQPFDYLKLSGKTVLYAKRDAAEQLRKLHGVSILEVQTQHIGDCYMVIAKASDKDGRTDVSTGVVPIGNLKGEALANGLMKAETKAKRRVTLSICGLGLLDETEIDTIPGAKPAGYSVQAPADAGTSAASPSAPNGGDSGPLFTPDLTRTTHTQGPAQGVPGPSAQLTIARVDTAPTRNKNLTKYIVVLSDGREVTTIKEQLGKLCEAVCQEGAAIQEPETKETRWGSDLVSLKRVKPETPLLQDEATCNGCGLPETKCVCDTAL